MKRGKKKKHQTKCDDVALNERYGWACVFDIVC